MPLASKSYNVALMRGSSHALPRRSILRLFEFGTFPSIAGSLKRTSDIARTWLTPTVPSLSSSVWRQTSGGGREGTGAGVGATAATCAGGDVARPDAAGGTLPEEVFAARVPAAEALAAFVLEPTRTKLQG